MSGGRVLKFSKLKKKYLRGERPVLLIIQLLVKLLIVNGKKDLPVLSQGIPSTIIINIMLLTVCNFLTSLIITQSKKELENLLN